MTCRPANSSAEANRRRRASRPIRRRGVVLFIVMVVILMLSLAGLSFVLTMSTENKAVHVTSDELQIEQVVASGEELLKAFCGVSRDKRQRAGGSMDNPELFRGVLVVGGETGGRRVRFSIVSPQIEEDRITGLRFGAENESARLNLAVLAQWEEDQPGVARDALMNLPGMTESIADAILDWIDADAAPRPGGAEADYYAGLGLPYRPRNGVPTSLEELLMVRDVSRELLFGADLDFNYQVDPAERQSAASGLAAAGGDGLPWASLLTVYSAERNESYEGNPRINLNEKDLRKLDAQLRETFETDWARFIIAYRQFGPREGSAAGLARPQRRGRGRGRGPRSVVGQAFGPRSARSGDPFSLPAGDDDSRPLDLSLPAKYAIASVLDLVGVEVQLAEGDSPDPDPSAPGSTGSGPGSSERPPPPVLSSPFQSDRAAMQDYLPKLLDAVTLTGDKVIRGRINVNEAPRAVLVGVPGLSESLADQIVNARRLRPIEDDRERRYPTWLLTEGIVDLETMKRLMPYLTTGGDVFRAQVVGFFDAGGLSARAEVVVDGTVSPPRQVYWKDLRLLGRGYSAESVGGEPRAGELAGGTSPSGPSSPMPLPQID